MGELWDFRWGDPPKTSMLRTLLTVTESTQPGREMGNPGTRMIAEMVT